MCGRRRNVKLSRRKYAWLEGMMWGMYFRGDGCVPREKKNEKAVLTSCRWKGTRCKQRKVGVWCNEREHVGVDVPRAIARVVGVLGREKCTRKYAGMREDDSVC